MSIQEISRPGKPRRNKFAMNLLGIVFAWVLINATWQHALSGYLLVYAVMFGLIMLVLISDALARQLRKHWPLTIVACTLLAWVGLLGSYSSIRDITLIAASCLLALFIWPQGRAWLSSGLYRRVRRGLGRRRNLPVSETARLASSEGQLEPPPDAPIELPGGLRIAVSWALIAWLSIGLADTVFEHGRIARSGSLVSPSAMPAHWRHLNIGLALSGGGYRAALVHAGAINMLGELGVPISALSTVSGGSIIGSYLASGGSPRAFADAVADGRFRFRRDLSWPQHALRLPAPAVIPWLEVDVWPFGDYSRIDVQAQLLDRVLLDGQDLSKLRHADRPRLLLATSDLRHGLAIGLMDAGLLLLGPGDAQESQLAQHDASRIDRLSPVYFDNKHSTRPAALERLATAAAVSGAFPGAFSPMPAKISVQTTAEPGDATSTIEIQTLLADGGIIDNLGLNLMQAAALAARRTPTARNSANIPDAGWRLDLIIVSDGSKPVQQDEPGNALESVLRAIDLNGMATGALRPLPGNGTVPVVALSAFSQMMRPPDALIRGEPVQTIHEQPMRVFWPLDYPRRALELLVAMQPDRESAKHALHDFDAQHGNAPPGLSERSVALEHCRGQRDSAECGWSRLPAIVTEDMALAFDAFLASPTLQDNFPRQRVAELFRYGQYLALLQYPKILEHLSRLAGRQRMLAAYP